MKIFIYVRVIEGTSPLRFADVGMFITSINVIALRNAKTHTNTSLYVLIIILHYGIIIIIIITTTTIKIAICFIFTLLKKYLLLHSMICEPGNV